MKYLRLICAREAQDSSRAQWGELCPILCSAGFNLRTNEAEDLVCDGIWVQNLTDPQFRIVGFGHGLASIGVPRVQAFSFTSLKTHFTKLPLLKVKLAV